MKPPLLGCFHAPASLTLCVPVLGAQWGDEGKGKLVDVLAQRFDVVARCQVLSPPPWGFACPAPRLARPAHPSPRG